MPRACRASQTNNYHLTEHPQSLGSAPRSLAGCNSFQGLSTYDLKSGAAHTAPKLKGHQRSGRDLG